MNKIKLENYLISGLPINLGSLGIITQPKIRDIISNNIELNSLLEPFLISPELVGIKKDNPLFNEIKTFDLFFVEDMKIREHLLLELLINSLKIIYSVELDNIKLEDYSIIIDDKYIINRDNFDILQEVILSMFNQELPTPTKPQQYKSEAHRRVIEKMNRKREEARRRKELHLCDFINIVTHVNGYIGYDKVLDMTYFQLLNSYSTLLNINNYGEFLMYYTSPKFEVKEETTH